MEKEAYKAHYKKIVKKYEADYTEEGRIAKYARLEEAEFVLKNVYGISDEEIRLLFDRAARQAG